MKRKKRSQQPRYIVIKIQYYPISKKVIFFVIFLISYIVTQVSTNFITDNWVASYATKNSNLVPLLATVSKHKKYSLPKEKIIFHGSREKKEVALTFDADMTPGMKMQLETGEVASYYNKAVIDILEKTQIKATLFLTGMWIEIYRNEAKKLAENSLFELASHSYSHPSFDGFCFGLGEIPDDQDNFQLQKTQMLLKEITGFDNLYFRFPGGCYSQKDLDIVKKNKLLAIQWDSVGDDGFNYDPISIEQNVLRSAQNGSIIVLHMHGGPNAPMTAEALPVIIATLKEKGFTFVKLSELLDVERNISFMLRENISILDK